MSRSLKEITIQHFVNNSILPPSSSIVPHLYKQISKRLLDEVYDDYLEGEVQIDNQNENDLVKDTIKEIGGWEKIIKSAYIMPKSSVLRMKRGIEYDINSRDFNVYLENREHAEVEISDRLEYLSGIRENILSFYEKDSIKNKIINKNIQHLSSKYSNKQLRFNINYDFQNSPYFPLLKFEKLLSDEDKKTLFKTVSRTFRRLYKEDY